MLRRCIAVVVILAAAAAVAMAQPAPRDGAGLATDVAGPTLTPWERHPRPRGALEIGLGAGAARAVVLAPSVTITGPADGEELLEDSTVTITWKTTGPVARVKINYFGARTPLGGRSRGDFSEPITELVANTGAVKWKVPYIDAGRFKIRVTGYNAAGQSITHADQAVRFRPAEFAGLKGSYIAISKKRQRLFYYENDELKRVHIVSTAASGYWTPTMQPGSRDPQRGRMGQVFNKSLAPVSQAYEVVMPYWLAITEIGSHGIHATSPNFYRRLGSPASHGCVRQHRADAEALYNLVSVGTSVYVF